MNKVAFVFRTPPHGSASGREGLDAVLATSALSDEIAVFFIGDGVYQLLGGQEPSAVLGRHYALTFGLFELYDIEAVYACGESLAERGLDGSSLATAATVLAPAELRQQLAVFNVRLSF
ncbi:sulfurtransferase complex subunit TusC [Zobellella endophytica]|uniref:Sulfurtransferase complex subunit TusC n=1 Tax=Zobellella endophytica TaxID=2116700 RepID=A0A2P7QTT9_9GAMM|nr:sulfurtransferase complex subunit TusC [Zobellella endophytica]PSJ41350.1 sulfurtransferase complex subunit TusC [Zobellella endophytica]